MGDLWYLRFMRSYLLQKEAGGNVDTYSFTPGSGIHPRVEVLHYEDGEYRSEQVLETDRAGTFWTDLKVAGYKDGGSTPDFVPDAPEAIVASTDPLPRGVVMGLLIAAIMWIPIVAIWM